MTTRTVARGQSFDVPALDGIRALSVLLVFVAHAGLGDRVPGGFGVTVFFFLSGYLITTLLRLEADWLGRISLRDFYLRRALRILPPMYLVLLAAIAATLAGVLPGSISVAVTAIQAVHLSNYYSIVRGWDGLAPGTAIYWSLAVEEHFYLMFPLTYIVLRRYMGTARRQGAILALVCFGVLAWRVLLVFGFGASTDRTYIATDTRIDSILFGCILAIYGNPALDDSRVPERAWKWALFPLAVVGLLISFLVRDPRFQETVRYSLQGLALFPLFVVAIRYPAWGPFRILTIPLIRYVGVLSYAIYLIHQIVIFVVYAHLPAHPVVQGAIALAISVSLALVVHVLVERPCAGLRRKLARIHRTASDADPLPHHGDAPARLPA